MYNNSRRGGGNNPNTRRSGGKQNFVPGGQLTPQRGGIQQPKKQVTGGQTPLNQPQQQQQMASNQAAAPRQQAPVPQQIPQVQQPIEQKPVIQPMEQNQPTQSIEQEAVDTTEAPNGDVKKETEKKHWMTRKLPKREKVRRRNLRLSKMLQPKNALKILQELVQNPIFEVVENQGQYKAIVKVAGVDHVGFDKTKSGSKHNASENAIKYLLKHKKLGAINTSDDATEKMDTYDANESPEDTPLPWQQVASFALYKLFDSWDANAEIMRKSDQTSLQKFNSAKKMPENPATMNPIMFINQMYPQAIFDELQATGTPPNLIFNIQCNIDGQIFEGSGPSKKFAKKQAAYAACHTLMGINYPPEEYTPSQ